MYYAAETSIKEYYYKNNRRMVRTDGVFPTATMRLHQRIVGWHRKRRIPVRDADKPNTLSSYLIDPKYLENGEAIAPIKELPQIQPKASIPVYQYSRVTHDAALPAPRFSSPFTQSTTQVFKIIGVSVSAFVAELATRYHTFISPKQSSRYTVNHGLAPWWKQRLKFISAALLSGGLLVAAVALNDSGSTKPVPVRANPGPHTAQAASNSKTEQSAVTPTSTGSTSQTGTSTSSQTPLLYTPYRTTPVANNQLPPVSNTINSVVAPAPFIPSSGLSSSPAPSTTAPTPEPTQSQPTVTSVIDPVLTPVTNTVNDTLSTLPSIPSPL